MREGGQMITGFIEVCWIALLVTAFGACLLFVGYTGGFDAGKAAGKSSVARYRHWRYYDVRTGATLWTVDGRELHNQRLPEFVNVEEVKR
jgi:hypothetical protein